MIIFNYNVLSVNRFKQKKQPKKFIIENRKFHFAISYPILRYNLFTLWCHINSILFIDIKTILYAYNKIEYHIIINDNTKQITISQSLKSYGCGKDFKNFTIYGHGAICCRNSFNIFCQRVKNGLHIIIFCDYQSKLDLAAKKVQDQPKVTI